MLILSLDTATKTAGVALLKDGSPFGEITLNVGLTHSVSLLPALDKLLKLSGKNIDDVDALAFSQGPGSFTGLRIGGAFVTALAQTKKLPVYAVPTLDTLALNGEGFKGLIAPILDARKNEYYTATYIVQNGYINKIEEDRALTPEDFAKQFENPSEVMVLGDAVVKYKDFLTEQGFLIPSDLMLTPRPINTAYLAYKQILAKEKPLAYNEIRPYYLRASEAEVKLQEKCRCEDA